MDEWDEAWDELVEGLILQSLDGRGTIGELLLHIESDARTARWRY